MMGIIATAKTSRRRDSTHSVSSTQKKSPPSSLMEGFDRPRFVRWLCQRVTLVLGHDCLVLDVHLAVEVHIGVGVETGLADRGVHRRRDDVQVAAIDLA